MSNSSSSSSGIGFIGLLTVLFIGLKLTDHIDWSWWWVLAPIWIVPGALIALSLGALLIAWMIDVGKKVKRQLRSPR